MSAPTYFALVGLITVLGCSANASFRSNTVFAAQRMLGFAKPLEATPDSFYVMRVAPLFEERCSGCHGERRQKGKLRLDTFAAVIRGGRSGSVLDAKNHGQSELVRRITLPASNDKAMPPEDKKPFAMDEITVIKLWVAAGASGVQPVSAFKDAPKPVVEVKFAEIDEATVKRERAPLAANVAQLQARFPGVIAYESRGSADLYVNALNEESFGDAQLKALAPLSARIVWADFSGTRIGDASVSVLAAMPRLRGLRLSNTQVTDAGLGALMTLKELRSVSLVGTSVTQGSVTALRNKGIQIYDGKA